MVRSAKVIPFRTNKIAYPAHSRGSKIELKKRWSDLKQVLAKNTHEYCRNTTLHGLKYLMNEDLYPIERFFFGISFVTVVLLSLMFVSEVYVKWSTAPVIFSINPQPTFITREPFPAVTICNLNQAYKSQAEQYSIYSTEYAMIQMICKREVNVTIADTITDWSNLKNFIQEISQPCTNMLLTCRFGGVVYNCSEIFHPIVTDGGLCCTFNMIHTSFMYVKGQPLETNATYGGGFVPVKWSAESGYPKDLPKKFSPRTAVGTGESLGLSITLDVESDNYYCSSSNSIGFKILLHNPNEVPNMREVGLLLSPGRETKVRIFAQKTESVQNLRSTNKRYRHCLFQDEEKLELFSRYTQRNCEIECVSKMLLRHCGCLSYYMPVLNGNEAICSIYEATCVERVRLQSMLTGVKLEKGCPDICLPSCYDLTYLPDFFSSPLSHSGFQITNQVIKNISSFYVERNIAVVNIYFKENSYRSSIQTEFIGMTDFLSSVGGLIGLFFGFSFISLAEFVFYAMIRPCRVARKENQNHPKKTIAEPNYQPRFMKRFGKHLNSGHNTSDWSQQTGLSRELLKNISNSVQNAQNLPKYDDTMWNQYIP